MIEKQEIMKAYMHLRKTNDISDECINYMRDISLQGIEKPSKQSGSCPDEIIRLKSENVKLLSKSIDMAIAICDWDNYLEDEYESPKAQISWMYHIKKSTERRIMNKHHRRVITFVLHAVIRRWRKTYKEIK